MHYVFVIDYRIYNAKMGAMGGILLATVLLYLLWCRPYRLDCFTNGAYIARERTTLVNGIFILYVFLAHGMGYLPKAEVEGTWVYDYVVMHLRQLIVASFLFHSGYGVGVSICKKGQGYVDAMPRKRILPVLAHFAIAVTMFAVLAVALGRNISWGGYALSLIGWESVGNSNWYIFDILCLYTCAYLAMKAGRGRMVCGVSLLCVLVAGMIAAMFVCKPGQHYRWNTLPCFAAGFVLASCHDAVRRCVLRLKVPPYVIGLVLLAGVHVCEYLYRPPTALTCIPFAYGILLALSGIGFRKTPRFLLWAGGALFSIYIFQRMPMILLSSVFGLHMSPDAFLWLSFIGTLVIAWGAEKMWKLVDLYILG